MISATCQQASHPHSEDNPTTCYSCFTHRFHNVTG
jgi:hypothetical protein